MCRNPCVTIEPDERAAALEHGVRRDRRAVQDRVELGQADAPRASAARRMPSITPTDWSCGVLGVFASQTRWSVAVVEDDVRERPADVDAEPVGHAFLAGEHGRVAVLLDADVAAARVALEVLDPALARADLADHDARRLVALLVGDGLEELPDPEAARVARRAARSAGCGSCRSSCRRRRPSSPRRGRARRSCASARGTSAARRCGSRRARRRTRRRARAPRRRSRRRRPRRSPPTPAPRSSAVGRLVELHVDLAQRLLGERPATS